MKGATWLIAAKDLRLRMRDRSFFIIGVVAPLALAFIFNATFGSALSSGNLDLEFGLVDRDGSEVSASLRAVLEDMEASGLIALETFPDTDAASTAVDEDVVDAYLVIPAGFGEGVQVGAPTLEVVGDVDSQTSTAIAAAIARQFAAGIDAARLAVVTTASILDLPPGPELLDLLEGDPGDAAFTARLDDVSAETRQLDGTTYIAAGMAVFFVFFTVQSGVIGLLEEERDGTFARLMAAPISRASVVTGKGLLSLLLGVISLSVLVTATTLLMGARWGPPLGVAVLIIATVAAGVAVMGLVAGLARTPEGAENLASIAAVVLGMLGGVFFPIGRGEGVLSSLTLATPHYWFLRGLGDLAGGAPWTAALPAAGVLAALAVALGGLAWWTLNRRLAR